MNHRSGSADPRKQIDAALRNRGGARLVFDRGTPDLKLGAGEVDGDLVRTRFWGRKPRLTWTGDGLTVSYPGGRPLGWLRYALGRERAELELNPTVRWSLELHGGIQRLSADLRALQIANVDLRGGLSRAEFWLPRPNGTLRVVTDGGIGASVFRIPADTPLRVSISGAVASLDVGGEQLGAIGTGVRRETPDWQAAPDRVDLVVRGSVHHLEIDRRGRAD